MRKVRRVLSIELLLSESLKKKLRDKDWFPKHVAEAKAEVLQDAELLAKAMCPVDTGELEESIKADENGLTADAPWAVFNEYGCYNIEVGGVENPIESTSASGKACYRPFLRPAIWIAIDSFSEKLFSKLSATSKGVTSIRVASK